MVVVMRERATDEQVQNVIAEHGASPDVAGKAGAYVRWLKGLA